jgi:hypothetical protein
MGESYFSGLAGYECVCLTTFRKSGEAVPTPVWFAESGGKLYVYTARSSGKVKRIRNNSSVTVAPCKFNGTVLGPAVEARVRILPPEEQAAANRLLNRKYGLKKRSLDVLAKLQRQIKNRAYLEIAPPG